MIKTLAAVGVLLVTLTGCGGSGSSSADDAKAAKAISADIMSQSKDSTGLSITQTQADCIGKGAVKDFGTDKLISLGLLNKDLTTSGTTDLSNLSKDDATSLVNVFADCVDILKAIKGQLTNDPTIAGLPESVRACIDTGLTEDVAKSLMVDQFTGTTAGQQELQQKLMACVAGG